MAETSIEWTDKVWNPVRGCSRVSEGCRNCYAERMAVRFSGPGQPYEGLAVMKSDGPQWTGKVVCVEEALDAPLHWRKPCRVFVNSMSDLFHDAVPDEFIDKVFAVMALCPQHTFQVLTKRPERMRDYLLTVQNDDKDMQRWANPACEISDSPCAAGVVEDNDWPLPNVWMGVSVEDQRTADERIPLLLQTPAAVRWISAEPLLGPMQIRGYLGQIAAIYGTRKLDWVVVGGESGPGARPMHPDWARSLRDQCQAAGVAFFFKQWGEACCWAQLPETTVELLDRAGEIPGQDDYFFRVGKKAAGRLLDGKEHSEYPAVEPEGSQ